MFKPNKSCRLQLSSGKSDKYGQPIQSVFTAERCSVVKLTSYSAKSSVRADSSATRGSASEFEADAVILLPPKTKANVNDILIVGGIKLRISGIRPRFDVQGNIDHKEIDAIFWSSET
jgi:hypothetical protein